MIHNATRPIPRHAIRLPRPDDVSTAPIPVVRAVESPTVAVRTPSAPVLRPITWLRLLVVPLAIGAVQVPWWCDVLVQWPRQSALGALLVVPLLAALVGWHRLRATPQGPQIHDRQLDMILCVGLTALAVELMRLTDEQGYAGFYGTSFLVVSAAAIMTAGWGTRTVWHLRGSLIVLLLAWQAPWQALVRATSPEVAGLAAGLGGRPLDPLSGGGVLVPIGVGLLCGLAGAVACRGVLRRVTAPLIGFAAGVALAAGEWLVTGWAARRSASAVHAWTSGAVQLWTVLAVFPLVIAGVVGCALWRRAARAHRLDQSGDTVRAARRLTTAVPRAGFATSAVVVLAAGMFVLAAGAVSLPLWGVTL